MNLRYFLKGSFTLALALLTVSAWAEHDELNPNILEVKPGDTVKVSRIPDNIFLRTQNDPDDIIWNRLPTYRSYLLAAPPVHQSVNLRFSEGANQGKHIYFQVGRTSERLYLRLRWKDATENRATTVDEFTDGVAVQYALKGEDTSYMMGTGADKPVNIWYWTAHQDKVENLAAGGFGSTTLLEQQTVTGSSYYVKKQVALDNEWNVVMSRPYKASDKYDVNFERDTVPMAFAVWQGNDKERDGNKRITHTWILLDASLDSKTK